MFSASQDDVPFEESHHRAHGPDESGNIERRSVADFVSGKRGIVAERKQDWLHALEEFFGAGIQHRALRLPNPHGIAHDGAVEVFDP